MEATILERELVGIDGVDQYFNQSRDQVLSVVPAQYMRVLEVGCAEGNFRASLKKDCEYWGVEPSAKAATVASKRLHKVLTGLYDEVADQLPDGYFDLVICNDVIEHMVSHDAFLQAIKHKLAPGGKVMGSIPNVRYWENFTELVFRGDLKYEDYGVFDRTHLRFFTEKSLRRAFVENGYTIEDMRGINSIWDTQENLKGYIKQILLAPFVMLMGSDTRFLQFAFRICPN